MGEEAPGPPDQHDEAVREPDQVGDVDAEPEHPGGEAALPSERPEPRHVRDRRAPPDDRDVAVVSVPEGLVRSPEDAPPDRLRGVGAALHGALGDAGHREALLPRLDRGITDHEDLRVAGNRQVRAHDHPPDSIGLGIECGRNVADETRDRDPGAPQERSCRDLVRRTVGGRHPRGAIVDVDDPGSGADLHPEALELALGGSGSIRRVLRQDPIHRLDQDDPGRAGANRPEIALERVVGDLPERASELDPGRAAADDQERHPFASALDVRLALGRLEGDQDASPDLGGVLDRLEAGRQGRPFRVIEIRVVRARRHDQGVVGDRPPVGHQHLVSLRIEADRLPEDHCRVALPTEQRAQRLGDLARRQRAGRDLVEQRLEQVEVAPVDQGDPDLWVDAEVASGEQAREPTADHRDPVRLRAAIAAAARGRSWLRARRALDRCGLGPPPGSCGRPAPERTGRRPPRRADTRCRQTPPATWGPTSAATAAASMSPMRGRWSRPGRGST